MLHQSCAYQSERSGGGDMTGAGLAWCGWAGASDIALPKFSVSSSHRLLWEKPGGADGSPFWSIPRLLGDMAGAIDKLELRIPAGNHWDNRLEALCKFGVGLNRRQHLMQGNHYRSGFDLIQAGLSSLLYCRHRDTGDSKLVLVGVGGLSFAQIVEKVSVVFGDETLDLSAVRIDLAADVFGYSMAFFRDTVSVARKRSGKEYGTLQYEHAFTGTVETLEYGRRPNLIRIYDKRAQLEAAVRRIRGRMARESELHTQLSAASSSDEAPWTRVERQYGGRGIPKQLATLRAIRDAAREVNPFESITFHRPAAPSDLSHLSGPKYARCLGLKTMIERDGMPGAIREFNRRSPGKGRRQIEMIINDAKANSAEAFVYPDLQALYLASLERQLAPEDGRGISKTIDVPMIRG